MASAGSEKRTGLTTGQFFGIVPSSPLTGKEWLNVALTKEKIVQKVFETAEVPKNDSRQIVERALEIMKDTLAQGEDLLISGFGKFMVKSKSARRGRNPQTRQDIKLRARKVVVFKTSGVLRKRINDAA